METPAGDPGFLTSGAHGLEVQLATLRRVVPYAKRRRTAIDIGAHIGTWTCGLLEEFATVLAFEPQDENFRCLAMNAPSAELFKVALSDSYGGAAMAQHGSNSGCWRVAQGSSVAVYPLDQLRLTNVDFIKIDVEGYEGRVLRGAVETIERSHPTIFFEDNGLGEKLYGADWIDPKHVLIGLGYARAERIRKDELWTYRGEL